MSQVDPTDAPMVRNKTLPPPGVLPRHAQAWVLGGVALVMMLIIAFSGRSAPKPKPVATPTQVAPTDPNKGRIEDYSRRLEEETKKLNDEKAQLARQRAAQEVAVMQQMSAPQTELTQATQVPLPHYVSPQTNWIAEDSQKREYTALFASNIALSYRERNSDPEARTRAALDRTLLNAHRSGTADEVEPSEKSSQAKRIDPSLQEAVGPMYRLFEGTVLETVLTNRLDGSFSGPVNCMTTSDIYSHDGQHVLVPAGSRVLGEVKRVDALGQERLALLFHRLILPDGYSVSLNQDRGLNQIGETGLRDQINHHYLQAFGASIAIGALAGLSQANTRVATDISSADAYRQGIATSLSQSSLRILDRYLNLLPTITIREGHRVKVYLTDDLLLPAYENHRLPNGL